MFSENIEKENARPRRLALVVGSVTLLTLLLFPTPGEMADFMIGCSRGNFLPSTTCESVCRLLHNRTSCCYGVNYDSRAVCACCNLNREGHCPTVCSGSCHIITLNAGNCSELRGSKHRSGGGPSIINDLSILSDHKAPSSSKYKPRSDFDAEETEKATSPTNSTSSSTTKTKNSMSSTTNKLFSRLSSSLDFL